MSRIVISERFGGFGLSQEAMSRLKELGHPETYDRDIPRDDPLLLQVIDEMGEDAARGSYATLVVVDVPEGVEWHIHEYDGFETVHENHLSWGSDGEAENC